MEKNVGTESLFKPDNREMEDGRPGRINQLSFLHITVPAGHLPGEDLDT